MWHTKIKGTIGDIIKRFPWTKKDLEICNSESHVSKIPGCCSVTCVVRHLFDHRVPSPNAALQCQLPGLDMVLGSGVTLRRAKGNSSAFPERRDLKLKCSVKRERKDIFFYVPVSVDGDSHLLHLNGKDRSKMRTE